MLELNKKDRERCNNSLDKTLEMIKRKYEKDEVVEEDFEEDLINTIKGRYNLNELNEKEVNGLIQFIFSRRLKRILEEKEMKENDLAELTGITKGTITRYIKGAIFPRPANIANICIKLDVSPAYLLGLSHSPSLSYWNEKQALGLSIQDDEIKQLLRVFSLFIFNHELDFINFLIYSKEYVKIKQKLNKNGNSKTTMDNFEEVKNKIQKNIFESLDKIVDEKERRMKKNESSDLC